MTYPAALDSLPTQDVDSPDVAAALTAVQAAHQAQLLSQSVAFAATITPDPRLGETVVVGALTANLTVANPPAGAEQAGRKLRLELVQDGTGGRTVSFGNKYNRGATFGQTQVVQSSQSPAQVNANTAVEQSLVIAAANLVAGDIVLGASKPTAQAGLGIVGARLIDTTHIGVTFANVTAGNLTPTGGETYSFLILRQAPQPAQAAAAKSVFEFIFDGTNWVLTNLTAGL